MRATPLTHWLTRRFLDERAPEAEQRAQAHILEGSISVVLNTLLFGVKLSIGLMTGSIALMADAVHTISDSLSSAVVIVSARLSRRPPDPQHPFGYGRVESVGAVIISVLLGVAALEFGKASVLRLLHPQDMDASWLTIGVIAGTLLVKLWMSLFAHALGRRTGSALMQADAWHHATDVAATIPVIIAMVASRYGLGWLDGVMGLLVAIIIGYAAFDIARDATRPLLGEPPTPEEIAEIERLALDEPGVRDVHDIVIHKYGLSRVVSLHIETDTSPALTLHALAERVESRVGQGRHGAVVVHVDPVDRGHPSYGAVQALIHDRVAADARLDSFHDLRVSGDPPALETSVDLSVTHTLPAPDQQDIRRALTRGLRERFPGATLRVDFDPVFAYKPTPTPEE